MNKATAMMQGVRKKDCNSANSRTPALYFTWKKTRLTELCLHVGSHGPGAETVHGLHACSIVATATPYPDPFQCHSTVTWIIYARSCWIVGLKGEMIPSHCEIGKKLGQQKRSDVDVDSIFPFRIQRSPEAKCWYNEGHGCWTRSSKAMKSCLVARLFGAKLEYIKRLNYGFDSLILSFSSLCV